MCWWDWLGLHNKFFVDTVKPLIISLEVENNLCYVKLFERLFVFSYREKQDGQVSPRNFMSDSCPPLSPNESSWEKNDMKTFLFVSHLKNWNIPLFIISMFNRNFVFISLENSVIFFMIKPYHWHWFLTYIIIQTLEGIADFWNIKWMTRQGYQLNYERHPGINFPKGKLIENCKNNLYIHISL